MNLTEGKVLSLAMEVFGEGVKVVEIKKLSTTKPRSNPIDTVTKLRLMGYAFSAVGGFISFTYCRKGNPPKGAIPLLKELEAHKENGWTPRDPCLFCRACGNWGGHEGGPFCFYAAAFLGRNEPARPVTDELRANCPRGKYKGRP